MFEVSAPRSDLILFEPVSSTALSLMAMQAADTYRYRYRKHLLVLHVLLFLFIFYEVACLLFCFCLFGFLISEKISKLSKCPLLL